MKMNKIVLASLLSVSLLGASTSVFADGDETAPAEVPAAQKGQTATEFNVTGGDFSLNVPTDSKLSFQSLSLKDLVTATTATVSTPSTTAFSADVSDTLGDGKGWKLTGSYAGMQDGEGNPLGDTLNINGVGLSKVGGAKVVYSASKDDVTTALKETQGKISLAEAAGNVTLDVPKGAQKASYNGVINWTVATDLNAVSNK